MNEEREIGTKIKRTSFSYWVLCELLEGVNDSRTRRHRSSQAISERTSDGAAGICRRSTFIFSLSSYQYRIYIDKLFSDESI